MSIHYNLLSAERGRLECSDVRLHKSHFLTGFDILHHVSGNGQLCHAELVLGDLAREVRRSEQAAGGEGQAVDSKLVVPHWQRQSL